MTPWQRAEIVHAIVAEHGRYGSVELIRSLDRVNEELSAAIAETELWRRKHDDLQVIVVRYRERYPDRETLADLVDR
jgi:hypothetical protein